MEFNRYLFELNMCSRNFQKIFLKQCLANVNALSHNVMARIFLPLLGGGGVLESSHVSSASNWEATP